MSWACPSISTSETASEVPASSGAAGAEFSRLRKPDASMSQAPKRVHCEMERILGPADIRINAYNPATQFRGLEQSAPGAAQKPLQTGRSGPNNTGGSDGPSSGDAGLHPRRRYEQLHEGRGDAEPAARVRHDDHSESRSVPRRAPDAPDHAPALAHARRRRVLRALRADPRRGRGNRGQLPGSTTASRTASCASTCRARWGGWW